MTTAAVLTAIGIALAAALGASLRQLASTRLNAELPYGTWVVNVVASLALGMSAGQDEWVQTIVGLGALGALSTWSTVAAEVAKLARDGQGRVALLYLAAMTTTSVLAAWIGLQVSL